LITSWTKKLIAALLLTLLAAGCTMSFTYNHLDWLIPWYVDDYVDLSRQQRQLLQGQLGPVLQWHREEELERYLELLDRIEADLAREVTAAQVRSWADEIIAAAERVEENMVSVALQFGATLSDEQLAEFMESVWEEHREYEEEFLGRSDEEYIEENKDNLEEFLERFTGRLNDEQDAVLQRAAESLQRFDGVWLEDHEQWLNTLGPLLQRKPGWEDAVREAYANRTLRRSQQYEELLEYNMGVVSQAIADVLNRLNDKQRKHLDDEIEDFRSLVQRLLEERETSDYD
jgi:predicted outer membrane protein